MGFNKVYISILTILVLSGGFLGEVTAQNHNIVLIIADDLGVDALNGFGVNANQAITPHLDSMRLSGLKFMNAWASPVCTPTRAGMMSGKYGSKTGVKTAPGNLDTDHISLGKAIKAFDPSYKTAVVGKWHISQPTNELHPKEHEWDHYTGVLAAQWNAYDDWEKTENDVTTTCTEYATSYFTDDALNWVNSSSDPWFLWLAHIAPHSPFHAPPAHMYSGGQVNNNAGKYRAMIESMDYEIGRFIDSLTPIQKANTTFIFLGDNGTPGQVLQAFPSGRGKETLYQGGVHVPMFISGKGVTRIGEADSSLINVIDVYASVLEMLGEDLEGGVYNSYSFNHLLTGTSADTRKYNFTELDANGGTFTVEGYTIRDDQYKLIVYSDNTEEFFDVKTDTFELINILDNSLTVDEQNIYNELKLEASERINSWSCNDGIKNGDETSIDCGGTNCSACAVGSEELSNISGVEIYPNPASNQIMIKAENSNITSIKVTTIHGLTLNAKAVENQNLIKVDLQNYANQVLFVEVKTALSTQVIKVVKK
tara:strand:- start:2001 stop:3614 length:1614 start_codon:yes stop_codon:yes gene_type:complete